MSYFYLVRYLKPLACELLNMFCLILWALLLRMVYTDAMRRLAQHVRGSSDAVTSRCVGAECIFHIGE